MSYIFTGRLRAHTCGGSLVPVANATLMVYRNPEGEDAGFRVREREDIRSREYALLAQGRTDENGEFRIDFSQKTIFGYRGSTHAFAGEQFILDVCVRTAEGMPDDHNPETVQFSLGTVTADWQEEGQARNVRWEHDIPESDWSQVRSSLDAWTIHGRVVRSGDQSPVQGVNVLAFDADLMQDDFLGSATTDAEGRFRIDYPGSAFRQTSMRGADFERGGPELYFRIETTEGQVVYKEDKSRGNKPDRADASNCFAVELSVEGAPAARA